MLISIPVSPVTGGAGVARRTRLANGSLERFRSWRTPRIRPSRSPASEARIGADADGWLTLRWRVDGGAALVLPPFAGAARADGLWRLTCFELFVRRPGESAYIELNLSPSERWAAYDFTGRREGMAERPMTRAPIITPRRGGDVLLLDAALRLADLPRLPWQFGLTAVLEEEGGVKSFWALEHVGAAPDFHDPACFAARLAPRGLQ